MISNILSELSISEFVVNLTRKLNLFVIHACHNLNLSQRLHEIQTIQGQLNVGFISMTLETPNFYRALTLRK